MRQLYTLQLMSMGIKSALGDKLQFSILAIVMFVQNLIFFGVWAIFFDQFSSLKGWQLKEIATLVGVSGLSFGSLFVFFGGVLDLGRMIGASELDAYLTRPKSILAGITFKESRAYGVGDMCTAFVLWILVAEFGAAEIGLLLILCVPTTCIIYASALVLNSLSFFDRRTGTLSDQMLIFFIILSTAPQHGFVLGAKILMFTVIPAGFIAVLPVETMRQPELWKFAVLYGAAFFYLALSIWFFGFGLKRYVSGNRID